MKRSALEPKTSTLSVITKDLVADAKQWKDISC